MTTLQPEHFSISVTCEAPVAALDLLAGSCSLAIDELKRAMTKGAVWLVKGKHRYRLRSSRRVKVGEVLELNYDSAILNATAATPGLIQQFDTCSVWYKPQGMPCSGSRFADHHAVDRVIADITGFNTLLVHRLDRFTRGLLLVAHQREAAAALSQQFATRAVTKTYTALVRGELPEAITIDHPVDGKQAVTHIKPLRTSNGVSLITATPETGRKHQIRRHLAERGLPIVGDRLYGSDASQDLQLVASKLALDIAGTGRRTFKLPEKWHLSIRGFDSER